MKGTNRARCFRLWKNKHLTSSDCQIIPWISTVLYKSVILFYHDQSRPVCGDCLDCVANMATSKHESKYELKNNLEKNCCCVCDHLFHLILIFRKRTERLLSKKCPVSFPVQFAKCNLDADILARPQMHSAVFCSWEKTSDSQQFMRWLTDAAVYSRIIFQRHSF